jgi:hypothetical protein
MTRINSILDQRMKKPSNTSKMAAMGKRSSNGELSSFSGVFSVADLSSGEKEGLEDILKKYTFDDDQEIDIDLKTLISITSEVKAINNQAALLHGERIKKAHQILINYQEGAFTAWMIAAYGNRQTPYNLMQYYEFCETMPKNLRPQIELMPRQAIYALATRAGSLKQKQLIVENYKGETKIEMLTIIRQTFPLEHTDRRRQKFGPALLESLQKIVKRLKETPYSLSSAEKRQLHALLKQIYQLIGKS